MKRPTSSHTSAPSYVICFCYVVMQELVVCVERGFVNVSSFVRKNENVWGRLNFLFLSQPDIKYTFDFEASVFIRVYQPWPSHIRHCFLIYACSVGFR